MIINWNVYPDDGAIGYGLGTILTWTSSIPPGGWTSPTAVHSCCGGSNCANAIDKNTGTYWNHNDGFCNHWIKFDMGETKTLRKIKLYQGGLGFNYWGTSYGMDVYVSDDPDSWGSAVWTGALNAAGWQESGEFNKDGRYIKLITKIQTAEQQMYEFEAYCGTAGGGETIPIFMHEYRNLREA
jgi:hypothetical protein